MWEHTSQLMATVVNSQRTKNPVKSDKLHPFRHLKPKPQPKAEVSPLLRYL